jgi:hypothetical protein
MLKYRVDGIPHFVFLGKQGETIAGWTYATEGRIFEKPNYEPYPHFGLFFLFAVF